MKLPPPFLLRMRGLVFLSFVLMVAEARANRLLNAAASVPGQTSGSASATVSSQGVTAATAAASQAAQIDALVQRAQASMQRSLQAFQAQQAAQSAARAAASSAPSAVPNGLAAGGLVPDSGLASAGVANPVTTWTNAQTPTQSSANGQTTVTVVQTGQQALLYWQTFNVGQNTTLNFDQSAGGANVAQWVAVNQVTASIAPSQILGTINAPGQVYVINQNGIIFGGASQVNVGTLVASSLPINTNLLQRGLLNNPDDQFLFSQVNIAAGKQGPTAAFAPTAAPSSGTVAKVDAAGNLSFVAAASQDGDVVVQAGARIVSAANAQNVGGKVALVGPNVSNGGTISTPSGQTILAAGNQVAFAAHAASDPTLRGLDVYVGAVDASSGTASNTGLIDSPQADILMIGKTVNQMGVVASQTTVASNGRIDLLAQYGTTVLIDTATGQPKYNPTQQGVVTLGAGSVSQILPDLESNATVAGTELALPSLVDIQGQSILMGQGSLLLAPSASTPSGSAALAVGGATLSFGVTLNAGSWLPVNSSTYAFYNSTPAGQSSAITLAAGATIDVSGSQNVAASVAENIVSAQLTGTELADSPLQQNGPLRGQTITFDLRETGVSADGTPWIGTPLADVSGYANLVQRTVGELTTNGGTVGLNAGQSVNLQEGSTVDVSGGWINYQGGMVQTTQVVSSGSVLNISQATPDLVYDGIYTGYTVTSEKWGITQSYANRLLSGQQYEAGYIQGGNGGALAITAPAMTVSGNLYGNTVTGLHQTAPAAQLSATYAGASFLPTILATQGIPLAGALSLNFQGQDGDVTTHPAYSPTPARIDFGVSQAAGDLVLSPDLINTYGFGRFTVNDGDGSIFVPAGVALTTPLGGSIALSAANIDIEGRLTASGGTLSFTVYDYSPYASVILNDLQNPLLETPAVDPSRGQFKLGATASLDASGLVLDNRSTSGTAGGPPTFIDGGAVSIQALSVDLAAGSTIDVSGGAVVGEAGKVTYGAGGSLSVLAGQDPGIASLVGGGLVLGAELRGYSGSEGGSLALQAPLIQIGGTAADPANTLLLSPGFFDQGGFAGFTLSGLGEVAPNQPDASLYLPALSIASGTTLAPAVQSWAAVLSGNSFALTAVTLPLASQRTPASLTLNANGVPNFGGGLRIRGDLVLGVGAVVATDPGGSVALDGTTVEVLGSVVAPGGKITVSGAKDADGLFPETADSLPRVTVDLGPNSFLSAAGTVEYTYNADGYTTGSVLPGGTIAVSGNLLAETGAVLDVSGATGILDVSPTQAGQMLRPFGPAFVPARIDSSGGSIILSGGQELLSAATLRGAAGGPSAQGGGLTVSSQRFDPSNGDVPTTPLDATLEVTQGVLGYASSGIGGIVSVNGSMAGLGYFAADSFQASGLDALTLAGTVQFSGPVGISANNSLAVGTTGILYADAPVTLAAPYVKLGQAFQGPLSLEEQTLPLFENSVGTAIAAPPTYGTGSLAVTAGSLIDVGNLSLQGIGNLSLVAANGDIRGDGTLDVQGGISLTAGQIYPTTGTTFTIAAYDYGAAPGNGSIAIAASGVRQLPLSAGGVLNVYASNIVQGGVLRAPLGTINLGGGVAGASPTDPVSGQAFAATQNLTLASGSITSVSAVDPVTGEDLTLPYGTLLNGVSWIDPAGNDITTAGNGPNAVPGKAINVSAVHVADQPGATIDLRGGGDLYAYRFVSGTGGTQDILASTTRFAVIPGYAAAYSPYYSSSDYTNGTLGIGSQVYLSGGSGLPAGVYTLLPARYALLPGAFLVTPVQSAPSSAAAAQPDGSTLVAGYRFNGLDRAQTAAPLWTSFQVASQAVVASRAEYDGYSANSFLAQSAAAQGVSVHLPIDAGQLVLAATRTMSLEGSVYSQAPAGGLGGQVDIASPNAIYIGGPNTVASAIPAESLVLDSTELTDFGADSLLIGGYRQSGASGTSVVVTTASLTIDNAGAVLGGPDLILVSNQSLAVAAGSTLVQTEALSSPAESLLFGNATAGSGNGVLLRVSGDASSTIGRTGVVPGASGPLLTIGAGARIAGVSLILDSTSATSLDSTADLSVRAVSIDSGRIGLVFDGSQPASGLVLSSATLAGLQSSVESLSLLSYSSIDIYGSGTLGAAADAPGDYQVRSLALHAAAIRDFDGGTLAINAETVTLDDSPGGTSPPIGGIPAGGRLVVNADTLQLGGGSGVSALNIDGYASVELNAFDGILVAATASAAKDSSGNPVPGTASLATAGSLTLTTPVIAGEGGANATFQATGALTINKPESQAADIVAGGLGASLTLIGTSVTENSLIRLPSGNIGIEATQGDVMIGGTLDVGGTAQIFNDMTEYTSGGRISLTADAGSVILNAGSAVTVAAHAEGGNAGSLAVGAAKGGFTFADNAISGRAGAGGQGGSFSLDVGSIPGGSVAGLDAALGAGGFTQTVSIRDRTDANVSVDGTVRAASYTLSVDQGSITVTGEIDASNAAATDPAGRPILVGGTIDLEAFGSITLASGSKLTVAGQNFSNAGKGGSIALEAGSYELINGVGGYDGGAMIDIAQGSILDLSVAAAPALGDFTGTLHLRAPQNAAGTDVQIDPINGTIVGASSIVVEGYRIYTPAGGSIDSVEATILQDGETFAGNVGATVASPAYTTMHDRLFANNAALGAVATLEPGAEIVNPTGDLTLASDWDLSGDRFGPKGAPGVLSLRASGNLVFNGTLSDGFTGSTYTDLLMAANPNLPLNNQSWSYRLVAGADLTAADFRQVVPSAETYDPATGLAIPGTAGGSLELGDLIAQNNGIPLASGGANAKTSTVLSGYYQVIRTGTGDIDISASGDVLLQNEFATIYTAGVQADAIDNFVAPTLKIGNQTYYPAQYSLAGGNVTISAQGNIAHVTKNNNGTIVMDSERQLPNNWLYRRGYVDPATGQFGASKYDAQASTSWWVDFSNFFEGIGALGGGNVTLTAGHDVSNVDAVAPTNARMTYQTSTGDMLAADQTLTELGGGDVVVRAANDINGGAYYVERGQGTLVAGAEIITNSTRSPSLPNQAALNAATWLPTTLFLGEGSFSVSAQGDLLLGPVANPFLLPQGVGNTYWDKTYFSTYATTDAIGVSSLTGTVTLRESATLPSSTGVTPLLQNWFQAVDLSVSGSVAFVQPWLSTTETSVTPFSTVDALMPSTLRVAAFSGDIDTVGNLLLSPSPTGTVDLLAAGSINGLQPNGYSTAGNLNATRWSATTIDLSDADPNAIPGIDSPYAYEVVVGTTSAAAKTSNITPPVTLDLSFINSLFAESGSTEGMYGVLQTKVKLHASIDGKTLHADDADPVHLYAEEGDISGLTLFSGKAARVVAGEDITNIALYLQNNAADDVSVVAAGRDIIAYDANSPLQLKAQAANNALEGDEALAGDIQVGGPGTLEVLAGRNLNLGVGQGNPDGTGVGISSIGNERNPTLPFAGADIVAAAGIGDGFELEASQLDLAAFEARFLTAGTAEGDRYLPDLTSLAQKYDGGSDARPDPDRRALLDLDIFYLVLRDAGRDYNDPSSPDHGVYTAGYAAIAALFPGKAWQGDLSLTSREIKTTNGGNISLLAPGGRLDVGLNVAGTQAADQGVLTQDGGDISIFTRDSVDVGTSRIFTLNGGDEIIWSTTGDIDAGASSRTVQAAPPTRVRIDPQSGAVETDLAGLATGGGIGVLEATADAPPANVDLIAPNGVVNAGDAGIRASNNLNIAAVQVLNAGNIQVGGKSTGLPTVTAPNVAGLSSAAGAAGAGANAASEMARQQRQNRGGQQVALLPSIIVVEVLGYGGEQ